MPYGSCLDDATVICSGAQMAVVSSSEDTHTLILGFVSFFMTMTVTLEIASKKHDASSFLVPRDDVPALRN